MQLNAEERAKARLNQQRTNRIINILAPLITFSLLLLLWQLVVVIKNIPAWQIPRPSNIIITMVVNFWDFWPHILRSYSTIMLGFFCAVILGISMASLLNNFRVLGVALTPFINMLCTTPVITLVPLLLLIFGFGQWVMVFAVMLQAFPILNMNAVTGFNNVETLRLELMHSLRASRVQTFLYCTLPASLPHVFTGMKLSGIFATTACISSEFTGGSRGLGAQIIANTQFLRMERAFACIFFVACIGIFLYMGIGFLESKLVKWKI